MASNVQPYGPPINDALDNPKTTLETLIKLRDRAVAALEAHGGWPTPSPARAAIILTAIIAPANSPRAASVSEW